MNVDYKGPKFSVTVVDDTVETDSVLTIGLTCCPVTLNPLTAGESVTVTQYSASTGSTELKLTAQAFGPILFDNQEIVEVHRSLFIDEKSVRKEVHLIGYFHGTIQCRLRELRSSDDDVVSGESIENILSSFPRDLTPEYNGKRDITYSQGNYQVVERFLDQATGVVDLVVDDETFRCVCVETTREEMSGHTVKTYVSCATGKVVFVQINAADGNESLQIVEWAGTEPEESVEAQK